MPSPVRAIAIGTSGDVYLAGDTFVTVDGKPLASTPGPIRALAIGPDGVAYAGGPSFIARLSFDGTRWDWVLPLHGTGTLDVVRSLAVGSDGAVYAVGVTNSLDFPVRAANQPKLAGAQNAFVLRVKADGSAVDWGTYYGGPGTTTGAAVALDSVGNVLLTGTTDALGHGRETGFCARFDSTGRPIDNAYTSTGGEARSFALGRAPDGQVYAAGLATWGWEQPLLVKPTEMENAGWSGPRLPEVQPESQRRFI